MVPDPDKPVSRTDQIIDASLDAAWAIIAVVSAFFLIYAVWTEIF